MYDVQIRQQYAPENGEPVPSAAFFASCSAAQTASNTYTGFMLRAIDTFRAIIATVIWW